MDLFKQALEAITQKFPEVNAKFVALEMAIERFVEARAIAPNDQESSTLLDGVVLAFSETQEAVEKVFSTADAVLEKEAPPPEIFLLSKIQRYFPEEEIE